MKLKKDRSYNLKRLITSDTECKRNMTSALTESGIMLLGEKWLPKLDTKAIKRAVKNPDIGVLPVSLKTSGGFMAYKVCTYVFFYQQNV